MLHFTFIRKKQMTKKQTDINDLLNKKNPDDIGMNRCSHEILTKKMLDYLLSFV